jgi:hypothetical protein
VPKASGILRPISLLTVNDEIDYQACVNLVAEELQKRTQKRHRNTVFYHLYAGNRSPFFYLKWQTSYAAYADAIRYNFAKGLTYVATFDWAAFYDTIDHHVLKVFLHRTGVDPEITEFLLSNLKHSTDATWSGGSGRPIYHEHGIPQGPSPGRSPSLIPDVLAYVVKFTPLYNWRRFFGNAHAAAEKMSIFSKQRFETDIDAFVVSLDSFCDLVTRQVFHHRGHAMKAAYGSVLTGGAPAWLRADFPDLMLGFSRLHNLRIRSITAHPRHKTGALNKRITYAQYYRVRKAIVDAFDELARVLPL